eukprot:jgi/Astpho2/670/Aster-04505
MAEEPPSLSYLQVPAPQAQPAAAQQVPWSQKQPPPPLSQPVVGRPAQQTQPPQPLPRPHGQPPPPLTQQHEEQSTKRRRHGDSRERTAVPTPAVPEWKVLIEAYEDMTPAQRLQAQTKYTLTSHMAKATAEEPWTRYSAAGQPAMGEAFESDDEDKSDGERALAREMRAAHAQRLAERGAGAQGPVQQAQEEAHEAAIFGGEAATAQVQSDPSPAPPAPAARLSVALGDLEEALDGATVVDLPEEDGAPPPASAAEPSAEATGAAASSISWRERAAQIQAKRMQAATVGA